MVLMQSIYDYNSRYDTNTQHQEEKLHFNQGAIIDVVVQESSNGWSYGRIINDQDRLIKSNAPKSSNNNQHGWFPTSYVRPFDSTTVNSTQDSRAAITVSYSDVSKSVGIDLDHTDDDEGFYSTPMGGYIEPEDESNNNSVLSRHPSDNDTRDAPLPSGVTSVAVPDKRQLRIVTMPKNIINNVATTTIKVSKSIIPHHNSYKKQNSTSKPAVFISP